MHLSKIDLNLLVVLDTIYTEEGITRASERLNLSQPAISHALGRLRRMFNDPLFIRQGHVMVPTPLTRQIIKPIRRSLQGLQLSLNEVSSFDPAHAERVFTIGMRDGLELRVLPKLMNNIAVSAPYIDFRIVRPNRQEIESELASGMLDLVLDISLGTPETVCRQLFTTERLTVVARRGHPSVTHMLDLETYLKQEHIAISSRGMGITAEDFELGRRNLHRRVRLRSQHYFAAFRMVSETDLILTMLERYARAINVHFDNQLLAFPIESGDYEHYLYWHTTADADPANKWLRGQIMLTLEADHAPNGDSDAF